MPTNRVGRPIPQRAIIGGAAIVLALAASACSSSEPEDPTAFCDALSEASTVDGVIATIDIDDSTTMDMAMMELDRLVELVPDELEGDLEIVVTVYKDAIGSLAATAPGARTDVLREMQERLDEAGAPAAALQQYGETTCGIRFIEPPEPTATPLPVDIDD
ncbi:MAG: hypothetical protein ACR2PK_04355 [Acidimicrobiales bacterium]